MVYTCFTSIACCWPGVGPDCIVVNFRSIWLVWFLSIRKRSQILWFAHYVYQRLANRLENTKSQCAFTSWRSAILIKALKGWWDMSYSVPPCHPKDCVSGRSVRGSQGEESVGVEYYFKWLINFICFQEFWVDIEFKNHWVKLLTCYHCCEAAITVCLVQRTEW